MKIISCGDSYTLGEGLSSPEETYGYLLAKEFKSDYTTLAQSGASEYLILSQIEEAVKLNPDLILVGHTSEYRWQVRSRRNNKWQGFLVANFIEQNKKLFRQWIFSEQLLDNKRNSAEHKAAWHAAGLLYYSEDKIVNNLWKSEVALQINILKRYNIRAVHIACFGHLHNDLKELTDDCIYAPLDDMKHIQKANDGSHAGPAIHEKVCKEISKFILNKSRLT